MLGPQVKLISAEQQLFILTLAQICLKQNHFQLSEKALALDLRMKILNNEMGELQLVIQDFVDEGANFHYRMQLLPYLQSMLSLFKQLMNTEENAKEGNGC